MAIVQFLPARVQEHGIQAITASSGKFTLEKEKGFEAQKKKKKKIGWYFFSGIINLGYFGLYHRQNGSVGYTSKIKRG